MERFILPEPSKIIQMMPSPKIQRAIINAIKAEPNRLFKKELYRYMREHQIATRLREQGIQAPSVKQVKRMISEGSLSATTTNTERVGAA